MTEAFLKLVDLVIAWWHALTCWTILQQEDVGFIRRFGKFARKLHPGFNWRWPLIEKAEAICGQDTVYTLDPQSLRTVDGVELVVRASVMFRVVDAKRFHLEAWGALGNIRELVAGEISAAVRAALVADVHSGVALKAALIGAREQATKWGIKIIRIRYPDLTKTRSLRLWQTQTTAAGED